MGNQKQVGVWLGRVRWQRLKKGFDLQEWYHEARQRDERELGDFQLSSSGRTLVFLGGEYACWAGVGAQGSQRDSREAQG